MSAHRVTVVDYGIGNLFSVQRAFEFCGAEVCLTSDAKEIEAARRLVLPGVGAFADGMQGLRDRGLIQPLINYARAGGPLLGICLGMQMLASTSEEFGEHSGLGLIPGKVVRVSDTQADGRLLKIPHVGWSGLHVGAAGTWQKTLLRNTPQDTAVYLVHSFHVVPRDTAHILATCDYGGHEVTAAVASRNVFGCQFHPEKSGPAGLRMLAAFLETDDA